MNEDIPIQTYKVNLDNVQSIEDVKAVLSLLNLTLTLGKGITPPKGWWSAIDKKLLIKVK
jgi:hypothetical protein